MHSSYLSFLNRNIGESGKTLSTQRERRQGIICNTIISGHLFSLVKLSDNPVRELYIKPRLNVILSMQILIIFKLGSEMSFVKFVINVKEMPKCNPAKNLDRKINGIEFKT